MRGTPRAWLFVTGSLQLILLGIVGLAAGTDMVWVRSGHFDVDAQAFGLVALLAGLCAIGALYYERVRRDDRLAAMLAGTSFLLAMSSSFSLLNYLLLTVAGPRIDAQFPYAITAELVVTEAAQFDPGHATDHGHLGLAVTQPPQPVKVRVSMVVHRQVVLDTIGAHFRL